MPSFKKTFAAMLRNYPLGHQEPVDALIGLMSQRESWENGEIIVPGIKINAPMSYSDLEASEFDGFSQLMRKRSETLHRNLIDSQMDGIVENPTDIYFRASYYRARPWCDVLEGNYSKDMAFLTFPDDIKEDWGQAILQFHSWVDQELRSYHRVQLSRTDEDDGTSHWPAGAKQLRDDIQVARERLFPIINGISYEEHLKKIRELSDRLINEILAEEQQQSSTTNKKVSP